MKEIVVKKWEQIPNCPNKYVLEIQKEVTGTSLEVPLGRMSIPQKLVIEFHVNNDNQELNFSESSRKIAHVVGYEYFGKITSVENIRVVNQNLIITTDSYAIGSQTEDVYNVTNILDTVTWDA